MVNLEGRRGDGTEVSYFSVTPDEARLLGRASRHLMGSSEQGREGRGAGQPQGSQ